MILDIFKILNINKETFKITACNRIERKFFIESVSTNFRWSTFENESEKLIFLTFNKKNFRLSMYT